MGFFEEPLLPFECFFFSSSEKKKKRRSVFPGSVFPKAAPFGSNKKNGLFFFNKNNILSACLFRTRRTTLETLYHNDMILPLIYYSTLKNYIVVISLLYSCYIGVSLLLKKDSSERQPFFWKKRNDEEPKNSKKRRTVWCRRIQRNGGLKNRSEKNRRIQWCSSEEFKEMVGCRSELKNSKKRKEKKRKEKKRKEKKRWLVSKKKVCFRRTAPSWNNTLLETRRKEQHHSCSSFLLEANK